MIKARIKAFLTTLKTLIKGLKPCVGVVTGNSSEKNKQQFLEYSEQDKPPKFVSSLTYCP
jgi:hypothetical protein